MDSSERQRPNPAMVISERLYHRLNAAYERNLAILRPLRDDCNQSLALGTGHYDRDVHPFDGHCRAEGLAAHSHMATSCRLFQQGSVPE